jgi:lipopolysaccharide assembly outer membrane protein LptD (OstA)
MSAQMRCAGAAVEGEDARLIHRNTIRQLALIALLALCSTSLSAPPVWTPKSREELRTIRVAGKDVDTWVEGGDRYISLRDNAIVEQGAVRVDAQRILVRVDVAGFDKAKKYNVRIYADGKVGMMDGQRKFSDSAIIELATRDDVRAESPTSKIRQQSLVSDPFVVRAKQLLGPSSNQTIQRVAATDAVPYTANQATPPSPPPGPPPTPPLPSGPILPAPGPNPSAGTRQLNINPRTSTPFQLGIFQLPNGEKVILVTGGVLLTIRDTTSLGVLDIEAEQLVFWTKGDSNSTVEQLRSPDGLPSQEQEFYLAGDVQIRNKTGKEERKLRAEQVYYDVRRNIAVAVNADLELKDPALPELLHVKAQELYQLGPKKFEANDADIFASRLPSDPGLKLHMNHTTVDDTEYLKKTLFGVPLIDNATGKQEIGTERLVRGENVVLELEGVPIFYLPVIQGDANEPLGPLQNLQFRHDNIFGYQVLVTYNMYSLLRVDPLPNTRWTLETDYLSNRGPALGTEFQYTGKDLFGLVGPYQGDAKAYGIYDTGTDKLGGGRGEADNHPIWRGRILARHQQTFLDDFTYQGQLALLSDKNFQEQYYKTEFDTDMNQELFAYLKWQHGNFAVAGLVEPGIRNWVTQDIWLPRLDGAALGLSPFDLFTYNARASAGYGILRPTTVPPPPYLNTDVKDDTGRFDVVQDISLPFYLGPVKIVPYALLDLTAYTNDLNGDAVGRVYGGGGVRSSIPFTRLYPDVQSDLFNLCGINHKIVFGGNYFIAQSNEPYTLFPQLDRMNDDATDQALRDITPVQPALNPAYGAYLATSPIFNPQLYAIRRLVDNSVDTLDTIEVLQADIRQRWQTKRGYPGMQHVVDYFTLDLSASFFPHPSRDNFGKDVAFLEYDATWNIGDRTALVSSGLYDPQHDGAKEFTVGAYLNRTDRTNFFVGYRSIFPLESQAVTAAVTYIFSPKYAITGSATYDFGINQSLSNSLVITRIGTDLTVSFGINYNAILNNFGFNLELVPNIVAVGKMRFTPSPFSSTLFR